MNKRKLHHYLKQILHIKTWYLLVLIIFFVGLSIYGLRQNSLETSRLKDAVIKADETGGDIETPLRILRQHVHGHMNTNLSSGNVAIKPPIQLKNRYESLAGKESDKAKSKNLEVQKQAEAECGQKFPAQGFNSPRVACIAEYMGTHAVQDNSVPSELYKFDFVSPVWTPDLAGLSLLGAFASLLALISRLAVGWWYKYEQI